MKSTSYLKTYIAVLTLLSFCFILEFMPIANSIPKGIIIGAVECLIGIVSAMSAISLYQKTRFDYSLLFIASGFSFFSLADLYWSYLFYAINLPREHWISVSLTQIPYGLGYSCMTSALFLALRKIRIQKETKKVWLLTLVVILPFFARFIGYPIALKWINEPINYFLVGYTFNSIACSFLIYFALVTVICSRDIFWGLFGTGLSALVIENWSFRAESLLFTTPSYGFYDYIWAFGIGTATIPILIANFKGTEFYEIDSYEARSLVNNIKKVLILGLMACLALLALFASPEHYTLRFLTTGSLLVITSSLFSSQFISEKIEEFALMMSIEVADGLGGQSNSTNDRNLPLELQNLYKVALEERLLQQRKRDEERNQFSILTARVAHDLKSPLAALQMIIPDLKTTSEEHRMIVVGAMNRIKDICNQILINHNKTSNLTPLSKSIDNPVMKMKTEAEPLSALLDSIVSEKRVQYRSRLGIQIEFTMSERGYSYFVSLDKSDLKRVVSNLINNSVEALEDKGKISISARDESNYVLIEIRDNGKGIPAHILPKLMQNGFTANKVGGSGLGLSHAKEVLNHAGGEIRIDSKENQGTSILLKLPLISPPTWFAISIEFHKSKEIIILDDDLSIHQLWKQRFLSISGGTLIDKMLHFSSIQDLEKWLFSKDPEELEGMCFLIDYELVGERESGMELINRFNIQRQSTLVTSRYEDSDVIDYCTLNRIAILPKPLAGYVPIDPIASPKPTSGLSIELERTAEEKSITEI